MIVYPRHFVRFLDGRAGRYLTIAFLPGGLGGHIGTLQTDVRIELSYARKLIEKHQIDYTGFSGIQNTIDKGYCLKDNSRELTFVYAQGSSRPKLRFLVVKTDHSRQELWLKTFHPLRQSQWKKRMDRSRLIRDHSEDEFAG